MSAFSFQNDNILISHAITFPVRNGFVELSAQGIVLAGGEDPRLEFLFNENRGDAENRYRTIGSYFESKPSIHPYGQQPIISDWNQKIAVNLGSPGNAENQASEDFEFFTQVEAGFVNGAEYIVSANTTIRRAGGTIRRWSVAGTYRSTDPFSAVILRLNGAIGTGIAYLRVIKEEDLLHQSPRG